MDSEPPFTLGGGVGGGTGAGIGIMNTSRVSGGGDYVGTTSSYGSSTSSSGFNTNNTNTGQQNNTNTNSNSNNTNQILYGLQNEQTVVRKAGRQAICSFLDTHTCFAVLRTSGKVVVFDIRIPIQLAFYALVEHDVLAAPLWDPTKCQFVGLLTVTDFIDLLRLYRSNEKNVAQLAECSIAEVLLNNPNSFNSSNSGSGAGTGASIIHTPTSLLNNENPDVAAGGGIAGTSTLSIDGTTLFGSRTLSQQSIGTSTVSTTAAVTSITEPTTVVDSTTTTTSTTGSGTVDTIASTGTSSTPTTTPTIPMQQQQQQQQSYKSNKYCFHGADSSCTLRQACELLLYNNNNQDFLPIVYVDDMRVLGCITYTTILEHLVTHFREQRRLFDDSIYDLQIGTYTNIISVYPYQSLADALQLMYTYKLNALPVVENIVCTNSTDGTSVTKRKLIGVYSRSDITFLTRAVDAEDAVRNLNITVGEILLQNNTNTTNTATATTAPANASSTSSINSTTGTASTTPTTGSTTVGVGTGTLTPNNNNNNNNRFDVTTPDAIRTCSPHHTLQAIFESFAQIRFNRLYVVDPIDETLVGTVSARDLVSYFIRTDTSTTNTSDTTSTSTPIPIPTTSSGNNNMMFQTSSNNNNVMMDEQ